MLGVWKADKWTSAESAVKGWTTVNDGVTVLTRGTFGDDGTGHMLNMTLLSDGGESVMLYVKDRVAVDVPLCALRDLLRAGGIVK